MFCFQSPLAMCFLWSKERSGPLIRLWVAFSLSLTCRHSSHRFGLGRGLGNVIRRVTEDMNIEAEREVNRMLVVAVPFPPRPLFSLFAGCGKICHASHVVPPQDVLSFFKRVGIPEGAETVVEESVARIEANIAWLKRNKQVLESRYAASLA